MNQLNEMHFQYSNFTPTKFYSTKCIQNVFKMYTQIKSIQNVFKQKSSIEHVMEERITL